MVSATNVSRYFQQLMDDTHPLHSTTDHLDPTLDFLAGTAAGVSGLVVGFPFDTGELNPIQIPHSSLVQFLCDVLFSDWWPPSPSSIPHSTKLNTGSRTRRWASDTAPLCMRSRPSRARSASAASTRASRLRWCVVSDHRATVSPAPFSAEADLGTGGRPLLPTHPVMRCRAALRTGHRPASERDALRDLPLPDEAPNPNASRRQ